MKDVAQLLQVSSCFSSSFSLQIFQGFPGLLPQYGILLCQLNLSTDARPVGQDQIDRLQAQFFRRFLVLAAWDRGWHSWLMAPKSMLQMLQADVISCRIASKMRRNSDLLKGWIVMDCLQTHPIARNWALTDSIVFL